MKQIKDTRNIYKINYFNRMKKYKILIAFIFCWLSSGITLYLLNILWPLNDGIAVKNLIVHSFFISVVIIIILLAIRRKEL